MSVTAVIIGSAHHRRAAGVNLRGFECTISVESIDAALAAVEASGGRIVMQKCTLAGVGQLFFFEDPEGNSAGAMQYEHPLGS